MKQLFCIIFLGALGFLGCTEDIPPDPVTPDPVDVLSIDLSPVSGTTNVSTAELYATGQGRVTVKWFGKSDTTGYKEAATKYVKVTEENTYQVVFDNGAPLEYYFYAMAYDSAGKQLAKSPEVFYGDGPKDKPIFRATASPSIGFQPLTVHFGCDLTSGDPTDATFDCNGDGIIDESSNYTFTDPGTYIARIGLANNWGWTYETTEIEVVDITTCVPVIDSVTSKLNEYDSSSVDFCAYMSPPKWEKLEYPRVDVIWNFGDGQTQQDASKSGTEPKFYAWHTYYPFNPPYVCTLIVRNNYGADTVIVLLTWK